MRCASLETGFLGGILRVNQRLNKSYSSQNNSTTRLQTPAPACFLPPCSSFIIFRPTARRNLIPVIYVNSEFSFIGVWLDLCCGWIPAGVCDWTARYAVWFSGARFSAIGRETKPRGVFSFIRYLSVFLSSPDPKNRPTEPACVFSATPCFIFTVRHIRTHNLLNRDQNVGLKSVRFTGQTRADPHTHFWSLLFFVPSPPRFMILLRRNQLQVFPKAWEISAPGAELAQ